MQDLVVYRELWLTNGVGDSMLLDEKGRMCCLGMYLDDEGYPLLHKTTPSDVVGINTNPCENDHLNWLVSITEEKRPDGTAFWADSYRALRLMQINDSEEIQMGAREHHLRMAFHSYGVRVRFEGKHPKRESWSSYTQQYAPRRDVSVAQQVVWLARDMMKKIRPSK